MNNSVSWPDTERRAHFESWLQHIQATQGLQPQSLAPASADASFRRYLRIQSAQGPRVIMDAPPPQEDVRPYVHVAQLLQDAGLQVPQVLEADLEHGFLLLTDLGESPALQALQAAQAQGDTASAHRFMMQAMKSMVQMQQRVPASALPAFDAALLQTELNLFPTWCVQKAFGQVWTERQQAIWQRTCELLVANALDQPQVAVHADYMPRNLMMLAATREAPPGPGILDFQDAVAGAITYDTASLLRDAFITWDEEQELDWAIRGWELQRAAGLPVHADFGLHWQQLEWTGLQRHLKVLGIFCRLQHRDGKATYALDLPRFLGYATRVALRYGPLKPLLHLLEPLSGAKVSQGFTF